MRKRTSPARRRTSARDRRRRSAPWTAVAAAMLAAGLPAWAEPYETPRPGRASGPDADPGNAAIVDLQRQVNDLRSELLDIAIGIGGLWTYAKFRSIAHEASIGAAAARHYMPAPRDLLSGPGAMRSLRPASGPVPPKLPASSAPALTRKSRSGTKKRSPTAARRSASTPQSPAVSRTCWRPHGHGSPRGGRRRLRPGDSPRSGPCHGLPRPLPCEVRTGAARGGRRGPRPPCPPRPRHSCIRRGRMIPQAQNRPGWWLGTTAARWNGLRESPAFRILRFSGSS